MEENVQRVFSVLIAVVIFFLLPMYIAFEKKDDVSYSLAVRITAEFVENVRNNGYISQDMYNDYIQKLSVTNNLYDMKMEHKTYSYTPVIYSYADTDHKTLLETFEYEMYKEEYKRGVISFKGTTYKNLVLSYSKTQEIYTEDQILSVLDRGANESKVQIGMSKEAYSNVGISDIPLQPNLYSNQATGSIYTMSKGDEFTIRIKNSNTTMAEVFFNTLTVGMASQSMPRVYVNYGCTIANETYKNWVLANSGYTGNVQEVTITQTGTYLLEVWGASGGGNDPNSTTAGSRGGKGGYSKGQKVLNAGTKLYVYVGGQGTPTSGGFNGGGNGGPGGNGGGGATDIRTVGGTWNTAASLDSRIIIAGGGGGADDTLGEEYKGGINDGAGGDGGGSTGGKGYINGSDAIRVNPVEYPGLEHYAVVQPALGGNQVGGNNLKLGYADNSKSDNDYGGGGGGYYGGRASEHYNGGGGGGSGYIGKVSNGTMQSGINVGNGQYKITFLY